MCRSRVLLYIISAVHVPVRRSSTAERHENTSRHCLLCSPTTLTYDEQAEVLSRQHNRVGVHLGPLRRFILVPVQLQQFLHHRGVYGDRLGCRARSLMTKLRFCFVTPTSRYGRKERRVTGVVVQSMVW